jgi:hypothetical protein
MDQRCHRSIQSQRCENAGREDHFRARPAHGLGRIDRQYPLRAAAGSHRQPGLRCVHQAGQRRVAYQDGSRPDRFDGQPGPFSRGDRHVEAHGGSHRLGQKARGLGRYPGVGAKREGLGGVRFSAMGKIQVRPHAPGVQQQRSDFAVCRSLRGGGKNRRAQGRRPGETANEAIHRWR